MDIFDAVFGIRERPKSETTGGYSPRLTSILEAAGYGKIISLSMLVRFPIKSDASICPEADKRFSAEAHAIIQQAKDALQASAKKHFDNNALTPEEILTIVDAYDAAGNSAAKAAAPGATSALAAT
jgi:hypothetical protein